MNELQKKLADAAKAERPKFSQELHESLSVALGQSQPSLASSQRRQGRHVAKLTLVAVVVLLLVATPFFLQQQTNNAGGSRIAKRSTSGTVADISHSVPPVLKHPKVKASEEVKVEEETSLVPTVQHFYSTIETVSSAAPLPEHLQPRNSKAKITKNIEPYFQKLEVSLDSTMKKGKETWQFCESIVLD